MSAEGREGPDDRRITGSARSVALRGGRWRAVQSVAVQLLSTVTTMVLARLLTPEVFGIVAIVTIIVTLFSILTEVGFGLSVIRRRRVDERYLSSVFWSSSALGIGIAAVVAAAAPLLASLAGNPEATPYIQVASISLALGLVNSVPSGLNWRRHRFAAIAAIAVGAFVVYSAVAIPLAAFTSAGAWAIVVGRLAMAGTRSVGAWALAGWRPRLLFHWDDVWEDLGFNSGYLAQSLGTYLAKNVDYWIIGARLGEAALGAYYIAYVLPNVMRQRMTIAVQSALFVTVSDFADDLTRVRRAYRESIRFVALMALPVLVGIALVADRVVLLFFGPNWVASIAPLRVLAVGAAVDALVIVGQAIFTAAGTPTRNLYVSGVRSATLAGGLLLILPAAGLGAAAGVVVAATVVSLVVQAVILRRAVGIRPASTVAAIVPALVPTAVMVVAVLAVRPALANSSALVGLVGSAAVGAAAYLAVGLAAFREPFTTALRDVRAVVLGRRGPEG